MLLASRDALSVRHGHLREALVEARLHALVVTHLPNLFYLTNFQGTAGIAVVTPDRLYFIIDFRYRAATEELWASESGPDATVVHVDGSYDGTLRTVLRELATARLGVEGAHFSVGRFGELASALGASTDVPGAGATVTAGAVTTLVAAPGLVERLRIRKDAHEVQMLRRGAAMLSDVAADVRLVVRAGQTERELAAAIDGKLKQAGFERTAFETIVASGPNAALPHAHPGERRLQEGDLVVLDFGGVYGGYCVDLTRTVAVGTPDPEMRRVHGAVLEAQTQAIAASRPGIRASEIDAAARQTLDKHGLAEAFGHSTGHGLGIEVHEEPRIAPRRLPPTPSGDRSNPPHSPSLDDAIEAGMVFTIEPGAYIPGWGGVRIEDDVLVTPDGVEVLTRVSSDLVTG